METVHDRLWNQEFEPNFSLQKLIIVDQQLFMEKFITPPAHVLLQTGYILYLSNIHSKKITLRYVVN